MLRAVSSSGGGNSASFSSLTVTGQGLFADGSASAPSIAFINDPTTGIFKRAGTNNLSFGQGGTQYAELQVGGTFNLSVGAQLGWNSAGFGAGASDTMFVRDAAGLVGTKNSIAMRGGAGFAAKAIAGSYSVTQDDFTLLCSTASQSQITVLLPSAPSMNQLLNIKKVSADANRLVIDGNGNLIDALSTQSTIATTRPSFQLQFGSTVAGPTGSAWSIL